jgi:general secretion pathway protein C
VIVRAHLFGSPPAPESAPVAAAKALVLTGVIADTDPHGGLAILGETVAQARVYAVGDTLPGGARLDSVYPDHVLIDRTGRLESVALPHQRLAALEPALSETLVAGNADTEPPLQRETVAPPPQADSPAGASIAQIARADRVTVAGGSGYRISPAVGGAQPFLRLGLRPGDVLTAIGGASLDDPARSAELLKNTLASTEPQVTVIRNGVVQQLTLQPQGPQ